MTALDTPLGPLDVRTLARESRTSVPWTREHVATVVIADAVGLTLVLVGAWQANGQSTVRTGMSWLSVSLLGLAVAGAAQALWILRGRRSLGLAIRMVTDPRRMAPILGRPLAGAPSGSPGHGVVVESAPFVSLPGSTRYHRRECAFVTGKVAQPHDPTDPSAPWRIPCEVCQP